MSDFIEIIQKIISEHGEEVFENSSTTHAVLLDLAHEPVRDRILARHFVEAGGLPLLKRGDNNEIIIRRLREDFSIEANAAAWIVHVFCEALGIENNEKTWRPGLRSLGSGSADMGGLSSSSLIFEGFPGAMVAIGRAHTVGVFRDGTAVAKGRNNFLQCDVEGWRQIVAVAAGDDHTVGLMDNGRVLAVGRNDFDQCDVLDHEDIAAVFAFGDDTICLRSDGTALATGKSRLDLSHFEEIRSIAWHPEGVYGIRRDGRVMMSAPNWEEEDWALGLADAVHIISTYVMGSLVLTAGGRVLKMNEPDSYFAHLRDIVAIVDLTDGFAVLRADGMVRILPYDRAKPRKASDADEWRDISAIFGKYKRLIGLTSDGHLLADCTDADWLRRNGSLDFLEDWYPVGTGK